MATANGGIQTKNSSVMHAKIVGRVAVLTKNKGDLILEKQEQNRIKYSGSITQITWSPETIGMMTTIVRILSSTTCKLVSLGGLVGGAFIFFLGAWVFESELLFFAGLLLGMLAWALWTLLSYLLEAQTEGDLYIRIWKSIGFSLLAALYFIGVVNSDSDEKPEDYRIGTLRVPGDDIEPTTQVPKPSKQFVLRQRTSNPIMRVLKPSQQFALRQRTSNPLNSAINTKQPRSQTRSGTDDELTQILHRAIAAANSESASRQMSSSGSTEILPSAVAVATKNCWDEFVAKHYSFRFGDPVPTTGTTNEEHWASILAQSKKIIEEGKLLTTKNADPQLIVLCERLKTADALTHAFATKNIAMARANLPPDGDARKTVERDLEFLDNLTDEQVNGISEARRSHFKELKSIMARNQTLVTDLEILQVRLEERYRGTVFELPSIYEDESVRWPIGGKTEPADLEQTQKLWEEFVVPVNATIERILESEFASPLNLFFKTLQVEEVPDLKGIDEQLRQLIAEQVEIEQEIVDLRSKGIQVAEEELGVKGDEWLERLLDMPSDKLPKVDAYVSNLISIWEKQTAIGWKALYLQAIFEERYKGGDFSLPRLVLPGEVKLIGTCSEAGKEPYPMIMVLGNEGEGKIRGTLNWPTLSNSVTRFEGTITGDTVKFTEFELISGFGIALPCKYVALETEDGMVGTAVFEGRVANFSVKAETKKKTLSK